MNTKQEIRNNIKQLFGEQDREKLGGKEAIILERTLEYMSENNIKHICVYENMSDEVDTGKLIATLKESDINIYTPQVIGETEMILIDSEYEIYEEGIDLFIIPGRAFTIDGKRLGRGKGYYDRLLSQGVYKKSKKLGICYDFQILEDIPTQKHDINMDIIINSTC